jgi:hypothetical protein
VLTSTQKKISANFSSGSKRELFKLQKNIPGPADYDISSEK